MTAAVQTPSFAGENRDTSTIHSGQAVCCLSSRAIYLASASNVNRIPCVGLVLETTQQLHRPVIAATGFIELANWTAVIGAAQLTPRATYFLSVTPGMLTANPNEGGALICQLIGKSLSPTILQMLVWDPIYL